MPQAAVIAPRERERVGAPRGAFWLIAAVLVLLFSASAVPSPLYGVYARQWGFSTTTLTAVFAIYALFLLLTLLFFGSLSDYLGRRHLIIAGLLIGAVAAVVFLTADGVGALFAARALQGISVGLASGTLGAALIDFQPPGSSHAATLTATGSTIGLAVGALGSGVLVQYAPSPTRLVWWVILIANLIFAAAIARTRFSGERRSGVLASLRPRVEVPSAARGMFAVAAPCLVGLWALGGLYLSLGPDLAAEETGSANVVLGGLVISVLCFCGAAGAAALRNTDPHRAMLAGCVLLFAGAAGTFAAIATSSAAGFYVCSAVAGAGWGIAFLGSTRTLVALAPPAERAGLFTAIFVLSYLAFSIPALVAGFASTHFGLHDTALVYCAAVAVLVAAAGVSLQLRGDLRPGRDR
jgi:MFS family permease